MNNELLDTYQLKSLDGLLEAKLEKIAIIQLQEQRGRKRSKKRQFYLTTKSILEHQQEKNSSDEARTRLEALYSDNFPGRKPYDRVIRCTGFQFNFSIFDRYRFM